MIRDILDGIKDGICMGLGVVAMFSTIGVGMYAAATAFIWIIENVSIN